MKKLGIATVSLALSAAFWHAAPARAAVAPLLTDGSLETTLPLDQYHLVTASPSVNSNALAGWTITGGTIDVVPNSVWQSAAGTYSVDMAGSPGLGSITQIFATTVGTTYTLSFDLSANPSALTGELAGIKHLAMSASTWGAPVVQVVNALKVYDVTAGTRTDANMQYISETFQFTATWTHSVLAIGALAPTGLPASFDTSKSFCGPVIDNLVLVGGSTEPTPEPASLVLLAAALPVFLARRCHRREKSKATL